MRWILTAAVFLFMALIGHLAVLTAIPSLVMNKAQARMEQNGMGLYRWTAAPRMTPQTQSVVRPSPDLSYGVCRFDMADGPVLVDAPLSDTYGSLSIFDSRTDNVFVASLTKGSDFRGVIIHPPGAAPLKEGGSYGDDGRHPVAMSGKGLALVRRLAPDQQTHDLAAGLIEVSRCEKLGE